jgi:hypothetical protein
MSAAFMFGLQRVQGISTNTFLLPPNGADSASPNGIVIFHLPASAIVDTKRVMLHLDATTSGAAAGARLPPIQSLISRVTVSIGGVQVSSGHSYHNAMMAAKQAIMKNKIDSVSGHLHFARDITPVTNTAIATTGNEVYTAGQRLFSVPLLDHLELQPQYLDTSLVGTVEVTIQFADTSVLSSVAGVTLPGSRANDASVVATNFDADGAGNASYAVSNLRLSVPVIAFAGSFYDELIQSRLSSQGFIEYQFKNIFASQHSHNTSTRVSVSTQSLDRVWTAFRATGFATQGAPVPVTGGKQALNKGLAAAAATVVNTLGVDPGKSIFPNGEERYVPKAFNFEEPLAAGKASAMLQLQINGVNMPQSAVTSSEAYAITKANVLGGSYHCEDRMALSQYRDNFYVQCLARLNMSDGEFERILSGLDTRGSSADITLTTSNTDTSDLLIFLECSSTMRVGSGRAIEVVV